MLPRLRVSRKNISRKTNIIVTINFYICYMRCARKFYELCIFLKPLSLPLNARSFCKFFCKIEKREVQV